MDPLSPTPSEPLAPAASNDSGDRISVTDVHGTVARFEMTYSPPAAGRRKFGPPLRTHLPSIGYLCAALSLGAVVLYVHTWAPTNSILFRWIVGGDRDRPLSASVLAVIILVSAIATVVRSQMRGVVLSDDWIEARYLLPLGVPRARRWAWAQVLRIIVDGSRIAFEFWDGSFERLPEVAKAHTLVEAIMSQAQRRRIDVTTLDPRAAPDPHL
ncbi:MAG: hypothetical protein ACREJ3_01235 [Polyangiaceae bacterium]